MSSDELHARLRAADIPVPPPMTPERQAEWEERLRQAAVDNEEFHAARQKPDLREGL